MWQTGNEGYDNDAFREEVINNPAPQSPAVFRENPRTPTSPIPPVTSSEHPTNRRPIPISTIEWRSTTMSQFNPIHGLDFLHGADEVYIQQTVELNDLLANVESENRYTVKIPRGETLYVACETSKEFDRMLWGSARPFNMRLLDQTQQEALSLRRKLACGTCCFTCKLQEMEVWAPPGDYLGKIIQNWSMMIPVFDVLNGSNDIIFKIEGPNMWTCKNHTDAEFKILSPDGLTQRGSIGHKWDTLMVGFNLTTTFPSGYADVRTKALLVGASFLLEYMYFEKAKKPGLCRCCC